MREDEKLSVMSYHSRVLTHEQSLTSHCVQRRQLLRNPLLRLDIILGLPEVLHNVWNRFKNCIRISSRELADDHHREDRFRDGPVLEAVGRHSGKVDVASASKGSDDLIPLDASLWQIINCSGAFKNNSIRRSLGTAISLISTATRLVTHAWS